jgi:FkbM family methyltransferase
VRLIETAWGKFRVFDHCDMASSFARGEYETFCRPWFEQLKAGDVFIDVGACYGFYSVYAALRGCEVHAFEPSPEIFPLLQENMTLNGVEVNLYQVSLYDREVQMTLSKFWLEDPRSRMSLTKKGSVAFDSMPNCGGFQVEPGDQPPGKTTYRAMSRTLDSYGFQGVRLLKVDAQGCDLRILCGARDTIKRCRPTLLFELELGASSLHGDKEEDYYDFARGAGYETKVLFDDRYKQFVSEPVGGKGVS